MHPVLRGAISGVVATIPMTVPIIAAEKLRVIHTPPPVQISDKVASLTRFLPEHAETGFASTWFAAHLGYGAVSGVVYALVRPALPGPEPVAGAIFGSAVWGVSYLGYLPILNLYPSPVDDATRRSAVMIFAHAIFGVVLAAMNRRLGGRR